MEKETLKKFKKGFTKGMAIALMASVPIAFSACHKDGGQNTPTPTPDPKPPVVDPIDPVEKTISVDKIYNDNFSDVSFDGDIQAAQRALAERVFNGLEPQITNISYNQSTKELKFNISYIENNSQKSGSMTFAAPEFFQQIRGKGAKTIVLELAQLATNLEVKESEVDAITAQLEEVIDSITSQISTSFANIKTSQVTVEKQQDAVETISFDELYNQVFGENYTLPSFGDLMQELLPNIVAGSELKALFTGFEGDDFCLYSEGVSSLGTTSLRKSLYRGENLDSILEYRNQISPLLEQGNLKETLKSLYVGQDIIEKNSEKANLILEQLRNYKDNAENIVNIIRNIQKADFKSSTLFIKTNELFDHKAYAEKLYGDKEIIYAGVSDLSARTPTNDFFNSNYCESFKVLSVFQDNGNIVISIKEIFVPWYSNSTTESLYKSFLNENKYQISSEETIIITDPVEVQRLAEYATASVAVFDLYGYEDIMETEEENEAIKERMPKSVLVLTK